MKDLFGEAYARKGDRTTSKRAADFMRGSIANKSERRVINAIWYPENEDGLISDEICQIIDGNRERWGSITPRLKPALRKGYIAIKTDSWGEITRNGRISGRPQAVYVRGLRTPEWDIHEA